MNLTAIFLRPFKQRFIYVFGADEQLNSQVQNKCHRSQVQVTALLISNWDKQFPLKAAGETYLWINSKVKALLLRHVLNRLYHGCCCLRWILGHKLSEKSNFETPKGFPTEARVPSKIFIQVDSFGTYAYSCRICPLEFFIGFRIISCNVFKDFWAEKTKGTLLYWTKTPWNKVLLSFWARLICYFWINILLAVSVPYVHVNNLNYALMFYPVMYILVNLSITGPIHTYPDIFWKRRFFLRFLKHTPLHVAYSNRFHPSTRKY